MKLRFSPRRNAAMTLLEVSVVVAVVVVLVLLLLTSLGSAQRKATTINCVNDLKQIGLVYQLWGGDHGGVYPMGVSVTDGGAMEMVATGNVVQVFQVMSNELSVPKLIFCPDDKTRTFATNFTSLANANISYFIGADVTNGLNSQMMLSGDCNLKISGLPVKAGLHAFGPNASTAWTSERHGHKGNIGLADGSAQTVNTAQLNQLLHQTGRATNRFALP